LAVPLGLLVAAVLLQIAVCDLASRKHSPGIAFHRLVQPAETVLVLAREQETPDREPCRGIVFGVERLAVAGQRLICAPIVLGELGTFKDVVGGKRAARLELLELVPLLLGLGMSRGPRGRDAFSPCAIDRSDDLRLG